jgi:hypothetical protein
LSEEQVGEAWERSSKEKLFWILGSMGQNSAFAQLLFEALKR